MRNHTQYNEDVWIYLTHGYCAYILRTWNWYNSFAIHTATVGNIHYNAPIAKRLAKYNTK